MQTSAVLRTATLAAAVLSLGLACQPKGSPDAASASLAPELWQAYQSRFIADGRVIDDVNGGISHSEGQAYGMLLAEAAADRQQFDQLWAWTQRVLQRPDGLFAWRYEPCPSKDAACVTDQNNASDGEILLAWALLRAHQRWQQPEHLQAAQSISTAVQEQLLVERQGQLFILPGLQGFEDQKGLTLNGSYWVFPALESFASAFPNQPWPRVIAAGQWLLAEGRFGQHGLPADWLLLTDQGVQISDKYPPRYGFDAVRIPLHLAWSRQGISASQLAAFEAFWQQQSPPPAWVDLDTNQTAEYAWPSGMAAIAALARGNTAIPIPSQDDGYFSWSLSLLSQIAARETQR
ncbi:MAG: hypothetical protein K0A95_10330 [Chromatiales bacterium]|nr:endoglucanase [Gammaproteobacteria bacterium]MBW6477455.1 hypothetical protein [Chromatiales bacterium]